MKNGSINGTLEFSSSIGNIKVYGMNLERGYQLLGPQYVFSIKGIEKNWGFDVLDRASRNIDSSPVVAEVKYNRRG